MNSVATPTPEHSCHLTRRRFLKAAVQAGVLLAAPQVIPARVLGKDGGVAPSERIVLGGIGIGGRGTYDLGCFLDEPDVQFVAICDVKDARRQAVKKIADDKYGNSDCAMYRDLRELLAREDIDAVLIATGPNWHAAAAILAANAGKDMYCEKPCTKNIAQSLALAETLRRTGRVFQAGTQRRSLPNFAFAVELAQPRQTRQTPDALRASGGLRPSSAAGWRPNRNRRKEQVDWDFYLGPAAWRPFNKRLLDGFNFEKGGGLTFGGGCLEWGSHCVDLCQWANDADNTAPIEYEPEGNELHARYANGVKLILRDDDWLPLGSCPVRFEGDTGWVETGRQRRPRRRARDALLAGKRRQNRRLPGEFPRAQFPRLRESRAPRPAPTPTRPASRTSPAMPPTSRSSSTARSPSTR